MSLPPNLMNPLALSPQRRVPASAHKEIERPRGSALQKGFRVMVNAALLEQRPQHRARVQKFCRSPRNNTRCMLYTMAAHQQQQHSFILPPVRAAGEKCCQIAFAQKGQKVRPAARNVIKQRELRMEREMLWMRQWLDIVNWWEWWVENNNGILPHLKIVFHGYNFHICF